MRFGKPASRDEAQAVSARQFDPWPAGEYEFIVKQADENVSKNGNEQLVLTLECYDGPAKQTVWDYLGTSEKMQWKVRQFFESIGMVDAYEAGKDIDPMRLEGRPGRCWLNIDPGNAQYPTAKNKVGRYIFENEHKAIPAAKQNYSAGTNSKSAQVEEDEIPF